MDKCREEFEKQRYWIRLFRTGVDFDPTIGEFGRYIANGSKITDAMDLESFNEKWESWANSWQHQQAKVDELQTLYIQQGINMLKLQKQVDEALKAIDSSKDYTGGDLDYTLLKIEMILKEQALKGDVNE